MSHQSIGLDESFQGPYRTSSEVKNRRCYGPLSAPAVCMVRWPKLGALEPKFEFFRRLDFNIFSLFFYFTDSWTMMRSPGNRFGVFAQCLGGRKNSHQLKHMVSPYKVTFFNFWTQFWLSCRSPFEKRHSPRYKTHRAV